MTRIVRSLSEIADQYDAAFVDLWGCVHNGIRAFPSAVAALQAFREGGGKVVLVTNAPRPRAMVERQIAQLGVPDDAWDAVATSGDSARAAMFHGAVGRKVWFVGEPGDLPFFEPLKIVKDPIAVERVELEAAEGIVCTGPFDRTADPETLRPQLIMARDRGLRFLCANPDIVVDRGETREWCAGALAKLYAEMGGDALYFGKPHPPIYDLARARLGALGEVPPTDRILCIGDGIATDIEGAMGEDMDSLFVTGGLAARETGTREQPDPASLNGWLSQQTVAPTYAIGFLR